MIENRRIEEAFRKIEKIVGKNRVSLSPEILYVYSYDMTENEPSMPDMVVLPETTEEVSEIVKTAYEFEIPIVPFSTGNNVGGLTIPEKGGIIVDLKRMKKIEVNAEDKYVIVEPGVSFGELKAYLDENHPDLIYSYPLAPPYTSVLANALLDGLNNLSTRYGAMAEWIQGLEAVLGDGTIVRTGACAVSHSWFGKAPLPDLSGLFISWEGTTGIVTKGALSLIPKLPFRKRVLIMTYNYETAWALIERTSKTRAFDEIAGFSYVAGKMLMARGVKVEKAEDDPEFLAFLEFTGNTKKELSTKDEILSRILRDIEKEGGLFDAPVDVDAIANAYPEYSKFAELPTTLDFLLEKGGLTWVGSYGPNKMWLKGVKGAEAILLKWGFPPFLVARSMKEGHYQVIRYIITFDRTNKEEVNKVRGCLEELAKFLLEIGYIPYKAPPWSAKMIINHAHRGFYELLKRIKKTVDPKGIMNPGKWNL